MPTKTKFPEKVHYINGQTIYSSIGYSIYSSENGGESWTPIFSIPLKFPFQLYSRLKLTKRLFRLGISNLVCLDGHTLVLMADGSIYNYSLKSKKLNPNITPIRGSRPLSLCKVNETLLYYGEYRMNPERRPVHIFCSEDGGQRWRPAYQFTEVRHIHGVFKDHYSELIWITTGDNDKEAAIWVTEDHFKTLQKVLPGSQCICAVQLLFTPEYVYFGSDTPLEKNYIFRFSRQNRKIERLQEVESSVFYGCKVGDYIFFSTVVEPSKVNKCHDVCIWGSKDGENWRCIASFRKDIWPMKLFQYGQISFPSGENNTGYLWFTPFATKKHLMVQRLNVKEMF